MKCNFILGDTLLHFHTIATTYLPHEDGDMKTSIKMHMKQGLDIELVVFTIFFYTVER